MSANDFQVLRSRTHPVLLDVLGSHQLKSTSLISHIRIRVTLALLASDERFGSFGDSSGSFGSESEGSGV